MCRAADSNYSHRLEPSQEGEAHDAPGTPRPANIDVKRSSLRAVTFLEGCEPDPHAQARRHRSARRVADVDSTGKDAVTRPRDSPIVHPHSNEAWIIVARPLRLKRLATNERPAPFHDPGAVHVERRLVSVEVLAGQEEAFLEAKRVPRAKADRLDPEVRAGLQEGFPDPQSLGRGREELEPRLSRVAGSGDQERGTSTGNGGVPRWRDGGSVRIRFPPPLDFRWNRARMGAPRGRRYEIDRHAGKGLHAAQVHRREPLKEIRGARTRERQEERSPRGSRHGRLARQRGYVDRAEATEERVGCRPLDENLAHVTHVEQADRAAHGEMLVNDPGILEGHLPSAELDHARPRRAMPFEQRSAQRHE